MWRWISRNAEPLEAVGTLLTVVVAVVAIFGVTWQLEENDRLQREQGARDTYREFLRLGIEKPDLAVADWCTIADRDTRTAYEHYVEYALYTAEQVMAADPGWSLAMRDALQPHASYLCVKSDWDAYSLPVQRLVSNLDCSNACR